MADTVEPHLTGMAAAVEPLPGAAYRAAAYPLLELAREAVAGHAAIAERVREYAEARSSALESERAARGAERAAAALPAGPGG